MKWPIPLDRPLAFFDIESTGVNRRTDRIVDLVIIKILPDGTRETHSFRCNPGVSIPPEATAIHGIRDEDVKDSPSFQQEAGRVADVLAGCDLAGYNILGFDIPVLIEEFKRAGVPFAVEGRRVVDAQRIFHKKEPRDLTAALAFYCRELHLGAHGALDDVLATIRVVEGQLERYGDLPRSVPDLDAFCNPRDPAWADRTGKLKWSDGQLIVNFGKKQGTKLREVIRTDVQFVHWMIRSDFPSDTVAILRNALDGNYPPPPAAEA